MLFSTDFKLEIKIGLKICRLIQDVQHTYIVVLRSEFYLCAIASPVNSLQFLAIPRSSSTIARNGILIWNPKCDKLYSFGKLLNGPIQIWKKNELQKQYAQKKITRIYLIITYFTFQP